MTVSSKPKPDQVPWIVASTATGKSADGKTYTGYADAAPVARGLTNSTGVFHQAVRQ